MCGYAEGVPAHINNRCRSSTVVPTVVVGLRRPLFPFLKDYPDVPVHGCGKTIPPALAYGLSPPPPFNIAQGVF